MCCSFIIFLVLVANFPYAFLLMSYEPTVRRKTWVPIECEGVAATLNSITHTHAQTHAHREGAMKGTPVYFSYTEDSSHMSGQHAHSRRRRWVGRGWGRGFDAALQLVGGSGGAVTASFHCGDVGEGCREAPVKTLSRKGGEGIGGGGC